MEMTPDAMPIALVLAAGFARRFGRDKRWVRLAGGRAMIDQVLACIEAAGLPARVVLRADDESRTTHAWPVPLLTVAAADAKRGLGASLAAAVRQLDGDQSCLVCLADMPFIRSETYRQVAAALTAGTIAVPVFDGRRGHPVAFAAEFLPSLRALDGDRGARALLEARRDRVVEVPVADAGIHADIDTVADLLRVGALGQQ